MKNSKSAVFTGLSLKFSNFRFFKKIKIKMIFNYNRLIFSKPKKPVQINFIDNGF